MSNWVLFTLNPAVYTSTAVNFYFRNILTMFILNFGSWADLDMHILFPLHTDFNEWEELHQNLVYLCRYSPG